MLPSRETLAAAGTAAGGLAKAGTSVGSAMGLAGAGATAAGLAALAAAAVAAAGALWAIDRLEQTKRGTNEASGGVTSMVAKQAMGGADVSKMLAGFREINPALESTFGNIAMGTAALIANFGDMDKTMREVNGIMGMTRDEFSAFQNLMALTTSTTREATQALIDSASQGASMIQEGNFMGLNSVVAAYNQAQATGNQAAMQFAAETLVASGFTAQSVEEAGKTLRGGLESFAENFANGSDAVKAQLAHFLGKEGEKGKAPVISMSGGQSFKITQDFRDQDPDRVAIAFQDGIGRAVTRRLGANTSSPFGT